MDVKRFDRMVKAISLAGTRRGLLQWLATITTGIALDLLFANRHAGARGNGAGIGGNRRHHKNRTAHKHRQNKERHRRKPRKCRPQAKAKTCAGKCGEVKNNCKKAVDCGSCVCDPACTACQICNAQAGECIPDPSIVCVAQDQCHEAGVCDPETGQCTNPSRPDNTPCDDGDPCTENDVCQNGVCSGTPKDCSAADDACNEGVCQASDGACIQEPLPEGTVCLAPPDACTEVGTCQAGTCVGGGPTACPPADECHLDGVCDPETGCTNPPAPAGTPCGANGQCDGTGACIDPGDGLVLSGGDFTTRIHVDDDLRVELNGMSIFNDNNGLAGDVGPITFDAQPGDSLRVVAVNVVPPCISLDPLHLHRPATGQSQVLDAGGVPQSCDDHDPGVFYDQTFTITI